MKQVGNVLVDEHLALVKSAQGEVHLSPRAMALLQCLMRTPRKLVKRMDIEQAVWPNQIVTESALNKAVLSVRKALGEDARYLRTVHRLGYVLNTDVADASASSSQTDSGAIPISPSVSQLREQPPTELVSMPKEGSTQSEVSSPNPEEIPQATPEQPIDSPKAAPNTTVPVGQRPANSRLFWRTRRPWLAAIFVVAVVSLSAVLLSAQRARNAPFASEQIRIEVESLDTDLANGVRALLTQRIMHRMKVLLDAEPDPTDRERLIHLAIQIDLELDTGLERQLRWRWSLSQGKRLQTGTETTPTRELNEALQSVLAKHLPFASDGAAPPSLPSRALELYGKALTAEKAGNWKQARDILQKALEVAPGQTQLLFDMARMLDRAGMERAAELYYRQIDQAPGIDAHTRIYAQAKLALREDPKRAVELWKQLPVTEETTSALIGAMIPAKSPIAEMEKVLHAFAETVSDADPSVLYLRSSLASLTSDWDLSEKLFIQIAKDPRTSPERRGVVQSRLADLYYKKGRANETRDLLQMAIANLTDSPSFQFDAQQFLYYLDLGKKSCSMRTELDALSELAIKLGSDYVLITKLFMNAQYNAMCDKTEEAILNYTEVISVAMKQDGRAYQVALFNRSLLYALNSRFDLARKDLKEIEVQKSQQITQNVLDFVRLRIGFPAKSPISKACFQAARLKDPKLRTINAKKCLTQPNELYSRDTFLYALMEYVAEDSIEAKMRLAEQLARQVDPVSSEELKELCALNPSACDSIQNSL